MAACRYHKSFSRRATSKRKFFGLAGINSQIAGEKVASGRNETEPRYAGRTGMPPPGYPIDTCEIAPSLRSAAVADRAVLPRVRVLLRAIA